MNFAIQCIDSVFSFDIFNKRFEIIPAFIHFIFDEEIYLIFWLMMEGIIKWE